MLSHVVFEDCPGFKFFGADDVLVVRSLGLPADLNEWECEHYELVSEVLGVPTDFMYERLNWAYHGGSDGWAMKSYHTEGGFSLADFLFLILLPLVPVLPLGLFVALVLRRLGQRE